tara:strand:+ start:7548 stop:10025 length:2478 start_codon:yes stop_codon:yes gene_type:complete
MNFNLVSDEDNGYQYTAYFGEQIEIAPDSKAYLNFSAMYRENGLFLGSDATLTISVPTGSNGLVSCVPTDVVDDAGAVISNKDTITFTETIAAGKYTTAEMQKLLRDAITKMCRADSGGAIPPPLDTDGRMRYYYSYDPASSLDDGELIINLSFRQDVVRPESVALDVTDVFNGSIGANGYTKSSNLLPIDTMIFDNYGLGNKPLFHYQTKDTVEDKKAQIEFVCDGDSNTGSVFMGLYNTDYAALPKPTAQSATTGAARPRIMTVNWENSFQFDPNLPVCAAGQTDITMLPFNPDVIAVKPAATNYGADFKVSINNGAGNIAYVYPQIGTASITGMTSRYVYTGSATITGLAAGAPITLIQNVSTGAGSGLQIVVTSNAAGEITATEIAASLIFSPGQDYEPGDITDMQDSAAVGVGSISVSAQKVCDGGDMVGILQPPDALVSNRDPDPNPRSMGTTFSGGATCVVGQVATTIIAESLTLLGNATSGAAMIPACFLGVEVSGSSGMTPYPQAINIYGAVDALEGWIGQTSTSQDIDIDEMMLLESIDIPALDERLHIAIRTYKNDGITGFEHAVFFEVGYYQDNGGAFISIYDSINDVVFFNDSTWFKGEPVTNLSTQDLQIPFRPFMSAQVIGEFLDDPYILPFEVNSGTEDSGKKKPVMIQDLQITVSQELGQILGYEGNRTIMPSSDTLNPVTMSISSVGLHWGHASYYIVIEELPLTNYKNKRSNNILGTGRIKKGMVKNILANVPLPFESYASSLAQASDALLIGGLYEPPKMIVVNLKNNKIVTNQLSVRIFRMESDEPATEIKQSIVNFTILEGDE